MDISTKNWKMLNCRMFKNKHHCLEVYLLTPTEYHDLVVNSLAVYCVFRKF